MNCENTLDQITTVKFGHRRIPPRACIIENKPHVRSFLAEILDDLGFITRECAGPDFQEVLGDFGPDLVVVGPLNGEADVRVLLLWLRAQSFAGRVMLFGGRSAPALIRSHEVGEQAGLTMLPPLGTPFRDADMHDKLAGYLPIPPAPSVPVDLDEALAGDWLEIWYQPKIAPRSLVPQGAEALVRVRHPTWGLIVPAYFVPAANDPYFHTLSHFVLARVAADSFAFTAGGHPVDISFNLPWPALEDATFITELVGKLPGDVRQARLAIEVDCADIVSDLGQVRQVAAQLAFRNIGLVIDDIGAEGAALAGRRELPVVEMKVSRKFVQGCADDRIKQAVCHEIAETAREVGARSVANGVEAQDDFMVVRDLGFDLVQGGMFAKPMQRQKFQRAMLSRRYAVAS